MKWRYWLKKIWTLKLRSMFNYLHLKVIVYLLILFFFYVLYYFVFFLFIGKISVDLAIGFSIFFLFYLIYKKGRRFIYNYIWSFTKKMYLNFFTLIQLLKRFKVLIYRYNTVYLKYFRYNFFALKIVSNSMSLIYNKLSLSLINNFLVNSIYKKLFTKLYYITTKTNDLPIEYIIQANYIYELNMFLAFDILFFLL